MLSLTFPASPVVNPEAEWLAGLPGEHFLALRQYAESCWAMAGYQAQYPGRGPAAQWTTMLGETLRTKGDLFDYAMQIRKDALLTGFFLLDRAQLAELASVPTATSHQQEIRAAFLAHCTRHEVRHDLYRQPLPAPLFDVLSLIEKTPPYRIQGISAVTKRVRLAGHAYFAKLTDVTMSGIPPLGLDEYNTVTATVAIQALCPAIGPAAALHIIAADGQHCSLVTAFPGRSYSERSVRTVASSVDSHWLAWIVLAEWLFGIEDRLAGNLIVDRSSRQAGIIDPTYCWQMSSSFLGWEEDPPTCLSFARQLWEVQDPALHFPRSLLMEAIAREEAVCTALRPFAFTQETRLRQQFAVLQAALNTMTGDIPLATLEQVAQQIVQ